MFRIWRSISIEKKNDKNKLWWSKRIWHVDIARTLVTIWVYFAECSEKNMTTILFFNMKLLLWFWLPITVIFISNYRQRYPFCSHRSMQLFVQLFRLCAFLRFPAPLPRKPLIFHIPITSFSKLFRDEFGSDCNFKEFEYAMTCEIPLDALVRSSYLKTKQLFCQWFLDSFWRNGIF